MNTALSAPKVPDLTVAQCLPARADVDHTEATSLSLLPRVRAPAGAPSRSFASAKLPAAVTSRGGKSLWTVAHGAMSTRRRRQKEQCSLGSMFVYADRGKNFQYTVFPGGPPPQY